MGAPLDALVVGAGPAGCASAIELARAGRTVLLVDRASFPRDKCCGDGLTTLSLRELEALGLDPLDVEGWTWIDRAVIRSPSGVERSARLPTGCGRFAATAPRRRLDAALLDVALGAGVRFSASTTVASLGGLFDEAVDVVLSTGIAIRVRHVVAADGAWSPVRRLIGDPARRLAGDWHAYRQYVRWDGPTDELVVAFEHDLLPTYFWCFPLGDGTANVGFGLQVGAIAHAGELAARWRELIGRAHLSTFLEGGATGRLRSWPIPAHVDRTRLATGRVLYAGDAAAACDVLTGEGIGQALVTGRLAAHAIVGSNPGDPVSAARAHERSVRARLASDHRASTWVARALSYPSGARGGVWAFGASPRVGTTLARWMFEDIARRRLLAPTAWTRSPHGAFGGP